MRDGDMHQTDDIPDDELHESAVAVVVVAVGAAIIATALVIGVALAIWAAL